MKLKKTLVSALLILVSSSAAKAGDIVSSSADTCIYEAYIKQFERQKDSPYGELLINTAKYFSGKPYVASTLELYGEEKTVVNLREFDCTTFVENCIALSQVIKSGNFSHDNYIRKLTDMRYREGNVAGYASRLHYTSDWIYENEKRGLLKNISTESGGGKVKKDIHFMTTHPQLYRHLKNNARNIGKLEEIEKKISKRDYGILPISDLEANQEKIKNGDIIVFATSIAGLDYSHMGIACRQNEKLHFIHASSKSGQVIIEKKTLPDYCRASKTCTGISVLRINP
ncbi:MAG: DUF1460 domain-containing protein [Prevotella sp.]|jgi:hypothetical protein|nr:DUF1460 domain-containing protein [Prevotella sp.]